MTPKGKRYSTSDDILSLYSKHPVVALVQEWREWDKLRNTYTDTLPAHADSDSRIHTTFNPTTAATGRLSSSSPNLQNIPIRSESI